MEPFLGTWVLDRSELFDEYLKERVNAHLGVPWLIRKMMQLSTITKTFSKLDDSGTYKLVNQSSPMSKTLTWDFKFNETFQNQGFEGKQHKITFKLEDNVLLETHVRIEESDHAETYKYIREGDQLVLNMECNGIAAKRFFKHK